jgi:aerobic-type carbon monoxide dehydrogenase small subunit (CoxS/CutS family)
MQILNQRESPMSDHELTDSGCSASNKTTISRRDIIKSVIATGVVSSTSYLFRVSKVWAQASAPGAVDRLITLNVNGQQRRVDVMKQETLVMTLRYKLGLTGTKLGCDHSECGNCTVMLDDVATYSCSTLTHAVRGRKITTIEGIEGQNGELHPVQKAMIEELGPQCGFCTPGQVVSAVALLKSNPKPTVDEARRAMSGNICRCGAYDHYLKAVMRASKEA